DGRGRGVHAGVIGDGPLPAARPEGAVAEAGVLLAGVEAALGAEEARGNLQLAGDGAEELAGHLFLVAALGDKQPRSILRVAAGEGRLGADPEREPAAGDQLVMEARGGEELGGHAP